MAALALICCLNDSLLGNHVSPQNTLNFTKSVLYDNENFIVNISTYENFLLMTFCVKVFLKDYLTENSMHLSNPFECVEN